MIFLFYRGHPNSSWDICTPILQSCAGNGTCICQDGYIRISEITQTCVQNTSCPDVFCQSGYAYDYVNESCYDIDECGVVPAYLAQPVQCDANATCLNFDGVDIDTGLGYNCTCDTGYEGDGFNCTNIDECSVGSHYCDEYAHCTDTEGSFFCTCYDGYETLDNNGLEYCRNMACDNVTSTANATCYTSWNETALAVEHECLCDVNFTMTDAFLCLPARVTISY